VIDFDISSSEFRTIQADTEAGPSMIWNSTGFNVTWGRTVIGNKKYLLPNGLWSETRQNKLAALSQAITDNQRLFVVAILSEDGSRKLMNVKSL
jgi:hypothetical protein